ncbi:MAG: undecaprenyl-diphosphatase UppP [Ignavibacteriaceae bacterium]|nr:undecaprenyl-diphosphatase UppP [Ignavibacteriaceae bacterium]
MSLFEAIILGIIQGLTEFLPISSTGHLTLAGKFMGLISETNPEQWTAFIAIIQLGTLASIIIYFWKDVISIISSFFKDNLVERKSYKMQSHDSKMGWLVIVGTIPVVIIGLLFKDDIEGAITKNLYVIASSLIGLAIILLIAEKTAKFKKDLKQTTIIDALVVGIAQAVALIPGSSRSGTTITGGLFMGLKREDAARFSFLLSMPAIFAAGVLQIKEVVAFVTPDMLLNLIVATIVSGISGYLAIDFLLKFLRKNSTMLFIIYRIALGALILTLLQTGIIQP